MRTTLDLPDDLLREAKIRAVREGRKLKDVMAASLSAYLYPAKQFEKETVLTAAKLPVINTRPIEGLTLSSSSVEETCKLIEKTEIRDDLEDYERVFGHQCVDGSDHS